MSAETKDSRVIRAKRFLSKLKHKKPGILSLFFSDEINFDKDQKVKQRNDKWLCRDPKDVTAASHIKFPAIVVVLGVVGNEGDIMPLHVFPRCLYINAVDYKVLEKVEKP